MRGGRVDHGGRQITLMGNGVLLGAPAAKQGSWEEWRKKHEWKWEEQASGQGGRVEVTLRVGVWTAWKGVEGLGAGSKKWQFQFPGTYNTDAKEGTLASRKGGEKEKRGRRKTRRGRRRMRKGKEKEDKKEKGEKEEKEEEKRYKERHWCVFSVMLPETVQYSAKTNADINYYILHYYFCNTADLFIWRTKVTCLGETVLIDFLTD